mgnify:CR=1 FL=1
MHECRPSGSLEDTDEDDSQDYEDKDPPLAEVRKAQKLAGGLNWLATRTRPDIAFVVSQISSAATRAPQRALALGKKCLRYLAGTKDHGMDLTNPLHSQGSGLMVDLPLLGTFVINSRLNSPWHHVFLLHTGTAWEVYHIQNGGVLSSTSLCRSVLGWSALRSG